MEDRLAIKEQAIIIDKCNALKLKRTQTFTLFHCEEFSKECISNISEVLLQKDHGNTHLIKSLKPTLDCLQPILLIYKKAYVELGR